MTENATSGAGNVRRTHPLLIVAAGAVTLFCLVGIGVMTGLIPVAQSGTTGRVDPNGKVDAVAPQPVAATNMPSTASAVADQTSNSQSVANANSAPAGQLAPIKSETLGQPNAKLEVKSSANQATPARQDGGATKFDPAVSAPTPVYATTGDNRGGNSASAPTPSPEARIIVSNPEPAPICRQCGTVDQITPVQKQGQGSGAGAVLGGLIGGVVGHQVGGGRGKDVATVAGAVGGALIGNQVEKSSSATTEYEVRVRLEDGSFRTAKFTTEPGMRVGDKVRFENGRLQRR